MAGDADGTLDSQKKLPPAAVNQKHPGSRIWASFLAKPFRTAFWAFSRNWIAQSENDRPCCALLMGLGSGSLDLDPGSACCLMTDDSSDD
jgi:hypothetical protein